MSDKTKAVLEITAPNGQEFVDKCAIVNQTKWLNGVCVEVYIPTKAVEASPPIAVNEIMKLVDDYGRVCAAVGDHIMPVARKSVLDALQSIQKPVDADSLQDQIAQAEADKKAYPLTWTYGWEMTTLYDDTGRWIRVGEVKNDGRKYRRLQHADLIMQCEQDKIDYPEFWHELTQWSNLNEDNWHGVPFDSDTLYEFNKYRQHPHRENIIKFHACSEVDKKRWQLKDKDGERCNIFGIPAWVDDVEYRLRPRVCFITLQEGTRMEYPEPVREALKIGQEYFVINTHKGGISKCTWNDVEFSNMWLKNGLIHLTEESAKQHLSALQAMNAQVAL